MANGGGSRSDAKGGSKDSVENQGEEGGKNAGFFSGIFISGRWQRENPERRGSMKREMSVIWGVSQLV